MANLPCEYYYSKAADINILKVSDAKGLFPLRLRVALRSVAWRATVS